VLTCDRSVTESPKDRIRDKLKYHEKEQCPSITAGDFDPLQ